MRRIFGVIVLPTLLATMLLGVTVPVLAATTSENLLKNFTLTSTRIDPQSRVVTVEGTVRCAPEVARVYVAVDLKQAVGLPHKLRAFDERRLRPCEGKTKFTLKLATKEEPTFVPAMANVRGFAGTCLRVGGRCDFDRTERMDVRLSPN